MAAILPREDELMKLSSVVYTVTVWLLAIPPPVAPFTNMV